MACELARFGIPLRIIDKNSAPTDKSKALVVWPRTLELLDKSGAVQPFLDCGFPLHGMNIFQDVKTRLVHLTFEDVSSPFPFVLALAQSETERLLESRLQALGIRVERSTALTHFEQSEYGVRATVEAPDGSVEVIEADWLVACDGGRSTVRHQLGIKLEGQTVPQEFAMADCDVDGLPYFDEVMAFTTSQGICAFFPILAPKRYRVFVLRDNSTAVVDGRPQPPSLEEMQQHLKVRGLDQVRLSNPFWLAAFGINERHAKEYRHGRIFLAGDAAHVHSPVGGQGMNTGMQDAFNLAWKLAYVVCGRAWPSLLDSYNPEREPVGAEVVSKTATARTMITLRHPVAQQVRNKVVSWLSNFDFVRHKIAEQACELAVSYPNSPLNHDVHQGHAAWLLGGGVRPGQRAPDLQLVALEQGEWREVRLFELMRDRNFHLIWFSGLKAEQDCEQRFHELCRWIRHGHCQWLSCHWIGTSKQYFPQSDGLGALLWDEHSIAHQVYGATHSSFYLVRPDGYVGLRCQPAVLEELQRYLERNGLRLAASSRQWDHS